MKKRLLLPIFTCLLILFSFKGVAQNKYWFQVKDKETKVKKASKFEKHDSFKKEMALIGADIIYYSSLLDAYSVAFKETPFNLPNEIAGFQLIGPVKELSFSNTVWSEVEYGYALEQIEAEFLSEALHLNGAGVKIGVIDGGFLRADKKSELQWIGQEQLKYFQDYILPSNTDSFYGKRLSHDNHGTEVLKFIGGYDADKQLRLGMADGASYFLARTDHGLRENRLEEDYWVMALESFIEKGVRLVNSSVGYTDTFDKKADNHSIEEVDGKSSMISQAAQAAAEKGILIVISAGNDGNGKWQTLSLPADAKDVLTVGATQYSHWTRMSYSSIGAANLAYVKPDVACYASNGTSYSAPVITGLAACIWQYDSTLTNLEVMQLIKASAHLHKSPNNYLGHGVPNAKKIAQLLLKKEEEPSDKLIEITSEASWVDLSKYTPLTNFSYVHKANKVFCIEEGKFSQDAFSTELRIERIPGAKYTTVYSQDKFLMEITWL